MFVSLFSLLLVPLAAIPFGLLLKERNRIRQQLAQKRLILESAFAGSASGMALLDLEGRLLRVNRALCELLGYPEHELLRMSFPDFTYRDDLAESLTRFQRLVAGETRSYQFQKRYVHRSGHLSWALVSNALVRDEQGKPRFCVAQIQEITDCKREADALANRERQLLKAQELAKVAGWEWDLKTDVITWSAPIYEVIGMDPQDYEPRLETYLDFVHPEDREVFLSSLERAKQDHFPFSIEQRVLRKNGEQRFLHIRGQVEVGPQSQALRMHGSAQDVTESRQALDIVFREAQEYRQVSEILRWRNAEAERQIAERDQELLARDVMFQRIVNHVPALVAYFDRNLACQWMSPFAQKHLRVVDDQVGQLSAKEFPLFGDLSTALEAAMAAGEPRHGTNMPLQVSQNGREWLTYWEYSLIPSLGPDGQPDGLLVFGHEVTDRIEKEQLQEAQIKTLEASEALKDHFLNTLSHEIRSPLTVILGTALLLQGEALGPLTEKQRVFIAKLLRNGRELTRLVNNVLEINLLRSARLELHPEPLFMGDLVHEVESEFQASASLKGQQLVEVLDEDLPMVLADRRRLLQIWTNLVSNAVQFAPEGARITLRACRKGDRLHCEVINTGSQISASVLPNLYAAMDHPARDQKGLGLGLGLSKALVEAHGGNLGVLSQEDAVTAWFDLPVGDPLPV